MNGNPNIKRQKSDSYRQLALALMIKKVRPNGMWYKGETLYNWTKTNLGLRGSYATMKKHVDELMRKGCFKKQGEHLQLRSRVELQEILGYDTPLNKRFYNQVYREKDISKMTINEASNWVISVFMLYELRSQSYHVKKNEKILEVAQFVLGDTSKKGKHTYRGVNRMKKAAAEEGLSTEAYAKRMLETNKELYIKTGCRHMASQTGISFSRCNKLLNGLAKGGFFNRQVVQNRHRLPITWESGEYLRVSNILAYPSRKYNYWIEIMGSQVTLPEKGSLYLSEDMRTSKPVVNYINHKHLLSA